MLVVDWETPKTYVDSFAGPSTRDSEYAQLTPACPDTALPAQGSSRVVRAYEGPDGIGIATSYWFPSAPSGATVGYTAPLVKWEETTITGLISTPVVLHGYYSQTYRPGHHNFSSEYIFEPRLEPGIAQSVLDELAAADIAYLYVSVSGGGTRPSPPCSGSPVWTEHCVT